MQQIHILINKDRPLLIIVQSVMENVTESSVEKVPTLARLCKTLHKMVEIFPLHTEARSWNCRLFQELVANRFLFVDETWFPLNGTVDNQNNR